ncbi:MAG: guanylate kinase [Myxococcota bacterium]|jgi:guanylate kinase
MSLNLSCWRRPERGALFVVTGASGTGKTTLVREALSVVPHLHYSVSCTTRQPRVGEVDGRDYNFVTREQFDTMKEGDDFLEWAEVYGNGYGTPRGPVEAALAEGRSILLEIDAQGAEQVRAAMPEAITLFVLPPSIAALEARLRGRASDSEQIIQRRLRDARLQLRCCDRFEYLVVNDDLQSAHAQFQAILVAELLRSRRHPRLISQFADN